MSGEDVRRAVNACARAHALWRAPASARARWGAHARARARAHSRSLARCWKGISHLRWRTHTLRWTYMGNGVCKDSA